MFGARVISNGACQSFFALVLLNSHFEWRLGFAGSDGQ